MERLAFLTMDYAIFLLTWFVPNHYYSLPHAARYIICSRQTFQRKQQMSVMHVSFRITQDIGESHVLSLHSRCCAGSQLPKTKITPRQSSHGKQRHPLWTDSTAVRHAARFGQRGLRRLGLATPTKWLLTLSRSLQAGCRCTQVRLASPQLPDLSRSCR